MGADTKTKYLGGGSKRGHCTGVIILPLAQRSKFMINLKLAPSTCAYTHSLSLSTYTSYTGLVSLYP